MINIDEVLSILKSEDFKGYQPFDILKVVSSFVNQEDPKAQELVLRSLERKADFGNASVILNGLVRELGLFPYLDEEELSLSDRFAVEFHKPDAFPDKKIVFHRPQAKIYRKISSGESVILSAPTSFGKSLIIDAIIAREEFNNIVIIVPTIALIDETRRRLLKFNKIYKIITNPTQQPEEKNVFILTQERIVDFENQSVDFFVIDEFYKLSPDREGNSTRMNLLNLAFYKLLKKCKHFYLLGPDVSNVYIGSDSDLDFHFYKETYQTVVTDLHLVEPTPDLQSAFIRTCKNLKGPTIVFCGSPRSTKNAAELILNNLEILDWDDQYNAIEWIGEAFNPEWHFVTALKKGIGIHHGRIPRALQQFIVHEFNQLRLPFLICTSTLIEGVNTKAKNIIIYDNQIARNDLDFFTFNNIKGRSGRMFEHFVGNVYTFHEAPQENLPIVDIPVLSQEDADDTLLLQIDPEDLQEKSKQQLVAFANNPYLSLETIKSNVGIEPEKQIQIAEKIFKRMNHYHRFLKWRNIPNSHQLKTICEDFIWQILKPDNLAFGSIRNSNQLSSLIWKIHYKEKISDMISAQIKYSNGDPDAATTTILDLIRLWANFHFPKFLRAISRIQEEVFQKSNFNPGNYELFARNIEFLQLQPGIYALDEFGIPLPLARKLSERIQYQEDIDSVLRQISQIALTQSDYSPFETFLIQRALEGIF